MDNLEDIKKNIQFFVDESDNLMEFVENLLQLARFEVSYSSRGRKKYGFGMTINKKIIEAHGGSVSVNSPGEKKGVEFIFTLPVE